MSESLSNKDLIPDSSESPKEALRSKSGVSGKTKQTIGRFASVLGITGALSGPVIAEEKINPIDNLLKDNEIKAAKGSKIVGTSDGLFTTVGADGKKATFRVGTVQKADEIAAQEGKKAGEIKGVRSNLDIESDNNWRFNLGMLGDINEVRSDFRLEASYRMLYSGAKLGTYIGIERGSKLEKYVLAQGFKIPNGKILVTSAFLKTLVNMNFSEVNFNKDVSMEQRSLGIDISQGFDRNSIMNEMKGSIVYYDVNGKNLGKIGDIIKDTPEEYDWTEVSGGVRGGSKLLAEFTTTFKITPSFRADVNAGYERTQIEGMFDKSAQTINSPTAGLKLTADISDYDRIYGGHNYSKTSQTSKLGYTHQLGNNIETFVEGTYVMNSLGAKDEQRVLGGIRGSFEDFGNAFKGKKKTKNPALYSDQADRDTLSLNDLEPNSRVTTDIIQIQVPVTFKKHKVYIDKTKLPGASNLEKEADGTLKAINFDTGASNLTTINSTNHPEHAAKFSVTGGRMLRIADFDKLTAPATYKIAINESSGGVTLFEFSTNPGSVELKLSPKSANGITPALAAQYISGALTIEQVQEQIAQLPAPTLTDLGLTNNPRPTWTWTQVSGATGYMVSIDGGAPSNIGNVTSYAPTTNLADGVHTLTIKTVKGTVVGTDMKSSTVNIDTTPVSSTLSFTKTYNSANISISSNEAGKGYYIMKPTSEPAPTDEQLKAGTAIDLAVGNNLVSLSGLTENTQYVFYFIAKDKAGTGNFQNTKTTLDITTDIAPDTIAPNVLTFAANPSTPTSISFKTKINENGKGYYLVVPSGNTAPTNAQIRSGTFTGKVSSGNIAMSANQESIITVNSLTGSTGYDVYFVAEDAQGNLQTASNGTLSLNTLATPDTIPPVTTESITAGDVSALVSINSNEAGEIRYINQPSSLPAPGIAAVQNGTSVSAVAGNNNINLTSLTQSTAYTLYYITKDTAGNWQTTLKAAPYSTIATPDTLPPVTSASVTPSDVAALAVVNSNETGTIYYINQLSSLPAPNAATLVATGTQLSTSAGNNNINLSGLTQSSAYTLYYITRDSSGNLQATLSNSPYSTIATPDTLPPVTSASVTPSDVAALAVVNSNEAGEIRYVVLPAGSPAPDLATVKSGTSLNAIAGNNNINISSLSQLTDYKLYYVVKDSAGNWQASVNEQPFSTIATPDTLEPMTLTFGIGSVTNNSLDFNVKINENGTGYYVIVPRGSAAPTSAQVMNNAVPGAVSSGQISLTANASSGSIVATGLAGATAYDLYFVAKDAAGNLQATPDLGNFDTLANAPSSAPTGAGISALTDSGESDSDGITNNRRPTINWNAVAGATGYEISFDGISWTDLGNITTYTPGSDLSDANYALQIRGKNITGNGPSVTVNFTIDTINNSIPSISISSITNSQQPTWTWGSVAGAGSYEASNDSGASWVNLGNALSFTPAIALADGTYKLSVRSKDAAGNISNASPDAVTTIDTIAPSKNYETFPTLDTSGGAGSGTINFNEIVTSVSGATFKSTSDNTVLNGIGSITGTGTDTLTVNFIAPQGVGISGTDVYIEMTVTDAAGNQRVIRTGDYLIF